MSTDALLGFLGVGQEERYVVVAGFRPAPGVGFASSGRAAPLWLTRPSPVEAVLGCLEDADGDGYCEPVVLEATNWEGLANATLLYSAGTRSLSLGYPLVRSHGVGQPWAMLVPGREGPNDGLLIYVGMDEPADGMDGPADGTDSPVVLVAVRAADGDRIWSAGLEGIGQILGLGSAPDDEGEEAGVVGVLAFDRAAAGLHVVEFDADSGRRRRRMPALVGSDLGTRVVGARIVGGAVSGVGNGRRDVWWAVSTIGSSTGEGSVSFHACLGLTAFDGEAAGNWRSCVETDDPICLLRGIGMTRVADVTGDGVDDLVHWCEDDIPAGTGPALCARDAATGTELWRRPLEVCQ